MTLDVNADLILGFFAILLAGVVIIMFLRATNANQQKSQRSDSYELSKGQSRERTEIVRSGSSRVNVPSYKQITQKTEVEKAKSNLRTMTLKQEIIGLVMKRLFEAEDDGEISREEREQLAKDYEIEMKQIEDELNKSELIVNLNELEEIRLNIIKQFETTLSDTQQKIDLIIKELNIEIPEPEPDVKIEKKPTRIRRRIPRPIGEQEEDEPDDEEVEESEERSRRRESVEDRLDKLKKDVLKELEELERLELEA
jgi:DNA-binding ferritin-like protein (Dps family)